MPHVRIALVFSLPFFGASLVRAQNVSLSLGRLTFATRAEGGKSALLSVTVDEHGHHLRPSHHADRGERRFYTDAHLRK
jgi:hypothetical protein